MFLFFVFMLSNLSCCSFLSPSQSSCCSGSPLPFFPLYLVCAIFSFISIFLYLYFSSYFSFLLFHCIIYSPLSTPFAFSSDYFVFFSFCFCFNLCIVLCSFIVLILSFFFCNFFRFQNLLGSPLSKYSLRENNWTRFWLLDPFFLSYFHWLDPFLLVRGPVF